MYEKTTCPKCAEEIRSTAQFCPRCQHDMKASTTFSVNTSERNHPKTQTIKNVISTIWKVVLILMFVIGGGWWMWSYHNKHLNPDSANDETMEQKVARLETELHEAQARPSGTGNVQAGGAKLPPHEFVLPAAYGGPNDQGIHIKVPAAGKGFSAKFDPNGERELKDGDYLGNFTHIELVHDRGQAPMYAWNVKFITPGRIFAFVDGDHTKGYELGKDQVPPGNNYIELQSGDETEGELILRWVRLDPSKMPSR
jgi:hypothetical protein